MDAAKARMFENQTGEDAAILNADDAAATPYAPSLPRVYWFSRKQRVAQGAYVRGEEIVFRQDGSAKKFFSSWKTFRSPARTTSKTFWLRPRRRARRGFHLTAIAKGVQLVCGSRAPPGIRRRNRRRALLQRFESDQRRRHT